MTMLMTLLACADQGQFQSHAIGDGDVDEGDTTPPEIVYTPASDWAYVTDDFTVTATITDEQSALYIVALNYKKETGQWETRQMLGDEAGVYTTTIPSDDLGSAGIYYYIEAVDTSQNTAYAPDEGETDPYHLRLSE